MEEVRPASGARPVPERDEAASIRRASWGSFAVLRLKDRNQLLERITADTRELLEATVVRLLQIEGQDASELPCNLPEETLPPLAEEMEQALLVRAIAESKSLVSAHPQLDPSLAELATRCREAGITTHVLLARADEETHAALAAHWIGHERPSYETRVGFYYYWDNVGLAVALANEREQVANERKQLRQELLTDQLTGLSNERAFKDELARHADTRPLSLLFLDFDGLKKANDRFGDYESGGNVIIRAVGQALSTLARREELPARLHTAGDEFVVLLPGVSEADASLRAEELEAALEQIDLPESHRPVYRGASVGFATRQAWEAPEQTLGRAIQAMHARKRARKDLR